MTDINEICGMGLLTVSGISKKIGKDFTLHEINFTQQVSQKIAIAGETGSGKSTLLKIIAGLVQPDTGTVLFENIRVKGPDEELVPGHPFIAYLSQHFELRTNYRVEEVLEYANKLMNEEAHTLFMVCRIDHLLKRRTDQLSGGEKQRIALARLLISSPKLLLLDEPFSNLDMIHKTILKSVIHDLCEKLKISCILVSHDPMDTLSWADEIMVMKDGQILQQGTPTEIYSKPVNEYTAALFGSYNLLNPGQAKDLLPGIDTNGKTILIRPEQFIITKEPISAMMGTVSHVAFLGAYYELEVSIAGKRFTVRTPLSHFLIGDIVYISVLPRDVWYI